MAISAARYWRVAVFTTDGFTNASIGFSTVAFRDAAGTLLSTGGTASASGLTGGTAADAFDANAATIAYVHGNTSAFDSLAEAVSVSYDFGSAVLPDHVGVTFASAAQGGASSICSASSLRVYVFSSTNNTTWGLVNSLTAVSALGVEQKIACATQSVYQPPTTLSYFTGVGGIYGIVSEAGVAQQNYPVMLYERDSFTQIARTLTDENGGYSFQGLDETREYLVLSADPTGPSPKNALVYDRITPIRALSLQDDILHPFWQYRRFNRKPVWMLLPGTSPYEYRDLGRVFINQGAATNQTISTTNSGGFNLTGAVFPSLIPGLAMWHPKTTVFRTLFPITPSASAFTIEMAVVRPAAGQNSTIVCFGGPRADNLTAENWWSNNACYTSFVVEFTNTGAINVWYFFGTTPTQKITIAGADAIAENTVAHIVLTYTQASVTKCYINKVEKGSGSLAGNGALKSSLPNGNYASVSASLLDSNTGTNSYYGDVGGIGGVEISATGGLRNTNSQFTGRIDLGLAYIAAYDGDLSGIAGAVDALYDSFNGVSPGSVPFVGYAGELAQDCPDLWLRLQDTARPSSPVVPASGPSRAGYQYDNNANVTYNRTGFTPGCTATRFNGGYLRYPMVPEANYWRDAKVWGHIERRHSFCFLIRLNSLPASSGRVFDYNQLNGTSICYLSISSTGAISYSVYDTSDTITTINFTHTALATATDYLIHVTFDPITSSKARLYINGTMVDEQNIGTLLYVSSYSASIRMLSLGGDSAYSTTSTSASLDCDMQDFAWFGYELSAARIAAHQAARST